jgi:hypothetical protein
MAAPAKCPGCGTKLQPDAETCPNCPLSFQDAPPEKTALQSDTFRNFVMPALFFGGLAFAVWSMASFFWTSAENGAKTAVAVAKTATGSPVIKGGGVVPTDSKAIQGLVNEQVTGKYDPGGRVVYKNKAADDETGPGVISVMPEATVKAKPVREWKMRGVIYDLVTLEPVPGVHMIFTDNETNSKAQLVTDEQGRYRIILPPLEGRGYMVSLSKHGYAKTYLDPGTEGVKEKTLDERKQLAAELATLIKEPSSVEPNSESPLVTDFHMAPAAK